MRPRIILLAVAFLILALTVALASCGGRQKRNISTPEKALLGHWVTTERGMKSHYYFGDGTLKMAVPGRTLEFSYDVVYSDDKANKVVIEIDMGFPDMSIPVSMGLEKELVFSKNRKSITEMTELNGVKITDKWKYVDSKTEP